ncbi:hypothetical protein BJ138DRAFT_1166473, partial [Hygrophoropsis aurantiaca]
MVGKWCTEYTRSAEDGKWGVRVLHNFGRLGVPVEQPADGTADPDMQPTREKTKC